MLFLFSYSLTSQSERLPRDPSFRPSYLYQPARFVCLHVVYIPCPPPFFRTFVQMYMKTCCSMWDHEIACTHSQLVVLSKKKNFFRLENLRLHTLHIKGLSTCWHQCVGHHENLSHNILCVAHLPCVCVSSLVSLANLVDKG